MSTCGGTMIVIISDDDDDDDDTTVFWYIYFMITILMYYILSGTSINTIVLTWYVSRDMVILWYFPDNLVQTTWQNPKSSAYKHNLMCGRRRVKPHRPAVGPEPHRAETGRTGHCSNLSAVPNPWWHLSHPRYTTVCLSTVIHNVQCDKKSIYTQITITAAYPAYLLRRCFCCPRYKYVRVE